MDWVSLRIPTGMALPLRNAGFAAAYRRAVLLASGSNTNRVHIFGPDALDDDRARSARSASDGDGF